jgi:hypothetical protein
VGLYEQKYQNNIRTVAGLVNVIKQDDVTLECNTLAGAVAIQLIDIPANFWSTQWKLYVVDKNNNASVNNITVTAPVGFLINGAGSFVINSNGASLLIRVTSNTNFVGQYSVVAGGGGTVTNGANVGLGVGQIFKNLVGTILNFKTLLAGGNISLTNNADDVTINALTSYLYAKKALNAAVTYVPVGAAGTYSITGGQQMNTFDSKVESGVTGFDLLTGEWTVPVTGKYSVNAKFVTRLLAGDVNSLTNGLGDQWVAVAGGQMSIGIIAITGVNVNVVCSNKQSIIMNQISDINIECTSLIYDFTVGDKVKFLILNKTLTNVDGIADTPPLPNCYIDFSVIKVA